MTLNLTDELRDFIDLVREDAGDEALEKAWVKAFRATLGSDSRQRIYSMKHRILAAETANRRREGLPWTDSEIALAMNPTYSYTEVGARIGRTPEAVVAARKRHKHKGSERLREATAEMHGESSRVKIPRSKNRNRHERYWRRGEIDLIRDKSKTASQCADLLGRTETAVKKKRQSIGTRTGRAGGSRKWSEAEIEMVKSGRYSIREVAVRTNRTWSAVYQKRNQIEGN